MKRITRIIRPIICMAVLLFAMTTAVMGCYQKEAEPIDIPGRTSSGTSAPQPSATPAGEVIPSVDRQAELAEARAKNPDTVAWLYIPGAEVDDPVMQAEDNGYYLKLDENGEYAMQMIGRMILVILFIMLSPCRAGIAAQLKMSLICFL